jgi:hypothetical protein
MRGARAIVPLAALAATTFRTSAAGAPAPPTVIVLHATGNEITTEAVARVEGELGAAGFAVVDLPVEGDVRSSVERAGGPRSPVAAFAIVSTPPAEPGGASVAEIWVSDRIRRKTLIQKMSIDVTNRAREAEILAVQAVELLKASLAELWLSSVTPPAREEHASAAADRAVPEAPGPPREARGPLAATLGLQAGVGLVEGFTARPPLWAPALRVSHALSAGFAARIALFGLGPPTHIEGAAGSARVDTQIAAIEAAWTWRPHAVVVPLVFVSAGAQHVRVTGSAAPPYVATTTDTWAALTAAGVGAAMPLTPWLYWVAEGCGTIAWPSTGVRIADVFADRVGGPSLMVDAGLGGTLP